MCKGWTVGMGMFMIAACCMGARAQTGEAPPVTELPPVTIIGRARGSGLEDNANITQIITRDDIDRILPASIGELLEYKTGAAVSTGTGSGLPNRSVVSVNGLPPSYTLVLLNGTKLLSEHMHTGQNVDVIPPSAVERIEILRGAASAQYGADAIGGIVNIVTRRYAGRREAEAYVAGGTFNTYEAGGHVCAPVGTRGGLASFVSWERSDGPDMLAPAHRIDNMGYEHVNWLTRYDTAVGDKSEVYAWFNWAHNTMDWRGDTTDSDLLIPSVGLVHALTPTLDLSAEVTYAEWDADLNGEENELWQPEAHLVWRAPAAHTVMMGAEYTHNRFARTAVTAPDQEGHALYLQDEWLASKHVSLLAALRYDKVESLDGAVSPKLAILVKPADPIHLRASVSRGYHAPTLQELYEEGYGHGGTAYRFGNPDLDPEYSTTCMAGIDLYPMPALTIGMNAFYSDIDDMIVPVFEGAWAEQPDIDVWRRQNIDDAIVYGAEANLALQMGEPLRFECGYTWTDNEDEATGRQLPYSPGSSAFAKLILTQPLSRRNKLACFVGARGGFDREAWNWKPAPETPTDNPDGLTTELDDYVSLDLGARLHVGEQWSLFAKVDNVLSEDIENLDDAFTQIDGTPVYRIELRYAFAGADNGS